MADKIIHIGSISDFIIIYYIYCIIYNKYFSVLLKVFSKSVVTPVASVCSVSFLSDLERGSFPSKDTLHP